MVTRRDVVTTGALGVLATAAEGAAGVPAAPHAAAGGLPAVVQSPEIISAQALREIAEHVAEVRRLVRDAYFGPTLTYGILVEIRRQFGVFLKANQKYPDYCEIGPTVFTDLYDWHVRFQQPIEVSRVDNRTAIRFMFTWMVLRPEQADNYVGIPFDRG
jgi:hypothetical protein